MSRRWLALLAVLALLVVGLWRCTGAFEGDEADDAVTVFGPWLGEDADAFAAVIAEFEFETGVDVRYLGSNNFETDLRDRVSSGIELPDVALVPQPGLITELIAAGSVAPLSDEVVDAVVDAYPFERGDLEVAGEAYLVPYRSNVKSLVWYRPDLFEERGWEVPTTLDELHALVGEIADGAAEAGAEGDGDGGDAAAGLAPWCFSVSAGSASGWPATDWVEDLVLRRAGPDAYDDWVAGDLAYDDGAIRDAYAEFEELVLGAGRAAGGRRSVLEVRVSDAADPLFADPPGCAMFKQASFATSWFPTSIGDDLDFFVLPGATADEPPPLLTGGTGAVQFDDRPDVERFLQFLASPAGGEAWAERGGYLSTRDSVDESYYHAGDRAFAALVLDGAVQRFDASDLLTPAVRDVVLAETAAFVAGSRSLDEMLGTIESARSDRPVVDAPLLSTDGD